MYDEKKLVLYPSPEIYQKLQRAAERERTSMRNVVMRLLRENLNAEQSKEQ